MEKGWAIPPWEEKFLFKVCQGERRCGSSQEVTQKVRFRSTDAEVTTSACSLWSAMLCGTGLRSGASTSGDRVLSLPCWFICPGGSWLSIHIPDIPEIMVKTARPQSAFPGLLGGRTSRVTVAALDTSLTVIDLFTDQYSQLNHPLDTFLEHLNLLLRENTRLKVL